jgi:D-alanyl-D-alanine carboxypeptidase
MNRRSLLALCLPVMVAVSGVTRGQNSEANLPPTRSPTRPTDGRTTFADINQIAEGFVRQGYGPGLSIAAVKSGRTLLAGGFGLANLETETEVTPQTVFLAGSITKQFVAAAIMRLVQERRLVLDAPAANYLPEIASLGPITVRMLLTHTSGLNEYSAPAFANQIREPHSQSQMIEYIMHQVPVTDFLPGSKFEYSNSNYYLLGSIVERISGSTLRDVLAGIIADAGLIQTSVDRETEIVKHRAAGYSMVDGSPGQFEKAAYFSMDVAGGAGALRSTATDLAKWHQALLHGRIVNAASLDQMLTPAKLLNGQAVVRDHAPVSSGPQNYGFGLELGMFEGERTIAHAGAVPGFTAYVVTIPSRDLSIGIMINTDPNSHEPFLELERAARDAGSK